MQTQNVMQQEPELAALAAQADRLHVISVHSTRTLREFVAAALSYMPGWMRALYRVRWVFVRLLGTVQDGIPREENIAPGDISFREGDPGGFFTVVAAREGRYWAGEARDAMISGYLAVVAEASPDGGHLYHLVTMARYRCWTGRIYFNVINPFHHMVVRAMAREAAGAD